MRTTLLLLAALCSCAGGAGRRTAQDVPEPGGIEVHAFGVYEGGPSEVVLQRAEGPVLLVLTGYEAKTWRISNVGGVEIHSVVASGYHPQTVEGLPPGTPLVTTSYEEADKKYFYWFDGRISADAGSYAKQLRERNAEYAAFIENIVRVTGYRPTTLQGRYRNSDFAVKYSRALPANAQVHAVAVYKGEATKDVTPFGYPWGRVQVRVERKSAPLVLFLSAYEPTTWELDLREGVQIAAVILSGYHDQRVTGVPAGATILEWGIDVGVEGSPSYRYADVRLQRLTGSWGLMDLPGIAQLTGGTIRSFETAYSDSRFVIR